MRTRSTRRFTATNVAATAPAVASRRACFTEERVAARTAYPELAEAGSLRPNVLLVGSDRAVARVLDFLRPQFRHPIRFWQPGQAFVLPPPSCAGTLILRNIAAMSLDQQATLFDSLNEVADTRVVSTSRAPVFARGAARQVHGGPLLPPEHHGDRRGVADLTLR